jgi:hypothetical protein
VLDEPIRLQSAATPDAVSALFTPRIEIDPLFAIGGVEPHEPETTYHDFAKAFDYHQRQVLLLGAPGAGKTITLLHYGRDAVVKRMRDASAPLPVLGVIPAWDAHHAPPVDPLMSILLDDDNSIRYTAVETLGRIGDRRAVEPLINALNDKVRTIRLCAAWSLAQIGTPEVRPALEEWHKREYRKK